MLKGLDATELKLSEVSHENEKLRIDDGYFAKLAVLTQRRVESMRHAKLGEAVATFRKGIFDIKAASYTESGMPFVRIGDLKDGLIATENLEHIRPQTHAFEKKTALRRGDIVVSKTAYAAASWVNLPECNVSQDTIAVRLAPAWKTKLRSTTVVAFLNSRHGAALMSRQFQGNVQSHLSLADGRKIPVPLFDDALQAQLQCTYENADAKLVAAREGMATAEQTLLRALDLENWQPPEPLTYTQRATDVFSAQRIDADYFAPRVADLINHLGIGGQTLRDAAPVRCENFTPGDTGEFDYLEIGSARSDGTISSERMPCAEAPSRATWRVRAGDVVTSTVRPLRRLSALITPEQDGFVASSGFLVLEPKTVPAEVLLTYLRLPPVCELMDLHTSASLYPAISERDLLKLPFPKFSAKTREAVVQSVRAAHAARREAEALLAKARRAVEIAIEDSEKAALKFMQGGPRD